MEKLDTTNDIPIKQFVKKLKQLDAYPPVSTAYETENYGEGGGSMYNTQKVHLICWFRSQRTLGGGAYSRTEKNNSARITYNRLQTFCGLLWLAEAAGVSGDRIKKVIKEAEGKKHQTACAILRKEVPFNEILALLSKVEESKKSNAIQSILQKLANAVR